MCGAVRGTSRCLSAGRAALLGEKGTHTASGSPKLSLGAPALTPPAHSALQPRHGVVGDAMGQSRCSQSSRRCSQSSSWCFHSSSPVSLPSPGSLRSPNTSSVPTAGAWLQGDEPPEGFVTGDSCSKPHPLDVSPREQMELSPFSQSLTFNFTRLIETKSGNKKSELLCFPSPPFHYLLSFPSILVSHASRIASAWFPSYLLTQT